MPETAKNAYERVRSEIGTELTILKNRLIEHKWAFVEQGETDWGYVGDMQRLLGQLREINGR